MRERATDDGRNRRALAARALDASRKRAQAIQDPIRRRVAELEVIEREGAIHESIARRARQRKGCR